MTMLALLVVNWGNVYLVCFIVGFSLTLLSLLVGVFHVDLPGRWDNFLHAGHGASQIGHGVGHAHAGHVGHGHPGAASGPEISPINFSTVMAFLAWFGGVGYLLTSVYRVWYLFTLALATGAGLFGASIIFWYLVKVMLAHDHTMDPADFRVVGVVGIITNPIREGGTGEIVYVQGGSRKTAAARADGGGPIAKGTEVAVTRYEKGIAYVRQWDELTENLEAAGDARKQK